MKYLSLILLLFSSINAKEEFGYITYTVTNVGDYVQAIAAKQFLPDDSIGIDREFVGVFNHPTKVRTIINGWFMHTKELSWYRNDVPAPDISWPPSSSIDPLIISLHLYEDFIPYVLTNESIKYMQENGPIGARDFATMQVLQDHGIPSYFSGCLSLTLTNSYTDEERNNIIYAVDIDDECVQYIKDNTSYKVVTLTHTSLILPLLSEKQRLAYSEKFLEKYRKAKCVITKRFHVSMPCLAFETPVLFIEPEGSRFGGIQELLHTSSKDDFLAGKSDFDFNNPPENKPNYIPIRENLKQTVSNWIKGD